MRERIFKIRPTGIPTKSLAPFWRGDRAEDIVAQRVREQRKKKRLQALKRKRAKK